MSIRKLVVMHNVNGWGPLPIGGESLVPVTIGEYTPATNGLAFKPDDNYNGDSNDDGYHEWLESSPYVIHRKGDRVERMCDWLMSAGRRSMLATGSMSGQRLGPAAGGAQTQASQQSQGVLDLDDDQSGFSIYDTSKLSRSSYPRRGSRFGGGRYFGRAQAVQAPLLGQLKPTKSLKNLERERERQIMRLRKQQGTRQDQKMQQQGRVRRLPTVQVRSDWTVVEEASFSQLTKLSMTAPRGETVRELGTVGYYDRAYDKLSTKLEKRLQMTHRPIVDVTTIDDPIVREMCVPGGGNLPDSQEPQQPGGDVYATDSILTTLMCCCRSVYPWDIKITKYNNKIFLDRRTNVDEITVSETSTDPPRDEEPSLNSAKNLSNEAMLINANFVHQVLRRAHEGGTKQSHHSQRMMGYKLAGGPNPFEAADQQNGKVTAGYRYRRFNLLNGMNLYVRCRIDAVLESPGSSEQGKSRVDFVSLYALNEWDSKFSNGIDWRSKLDTQRGAVLASELRNNNCKMAKWTAASILSGNDLLKFGFVSRVNPRDPTRHVIRGVHTFNPSEFGVQMNLSMDNAWGIVRWTIDLLANEPDGTFCLMKDQIKPTIRLYRIPAGFIAPNAGDEDSEFDRNVAVNSIDFDLGDNPLDEAKAKLESLNSKAGKNP